MQCVRLGRRIFSEHFSSSHSSSSSSHKRSSLISSLEKRGESKERCFSFTQWGRGFPEKEEEEGEGEWDEK